MLENVPLQGRSLFEYRVHGNGRSDLYPDLLQLEMDTWICGSGIAFSQGVEEGSLGINATTCLLNINCYSLLFYMLQDAWSCLKMLVFARLGLPLYSGILQFSPQIQPFHLIPMHT